MQGFLSGFKLAPKPLQGVEPISEECSFVTTLPIKQVLAALTSPKGLTSWLGETSDFFAHVGIKFETIIDGQVSQGVITTLDLPNRVVIMIESLGELDCAIRASGQGLKIMLNVRRVIEPVNAEAWKSAIAPVLTRFERVLSDA